MPRSAVVGRRHVVRRERRADSGRILRPRRGGRPGIGVLDRLLGLVREVAALEAPEPDLAQEFNDAHARIVPGVTPCPVPGT